MCAVFRWGMDVSSKNPGYGSDGRFASVLSAFLTRAFGARPRIKYGAGSTGRLRRSRRTRAVVTFLAPKIVTRAPARKRFQALPEIRPNHFNEENHPRGRMRSRYANTTQPSSAGSQGFETRPSKADESSQRTMSSRYTNAPASIKTP